MTRTGSYTRGRNTPGLVTPGYIPRGYRTPGEASEERVSAEIDITAAGNTVVGDLSADRVAIDHVIVNPSEDDAWEFNVSIDGHDAFDAAQSPTGTDEQEFEADNPLYAVGASPEDVVFEVTADGLGTAVVEVVVTVEDS